MSTRYIPERRPLDFKDAKDGRYNDLEDQLYKPNLPLASHRNY